MQVPRWKMKIKNACQLVGTYNEAFDCSITKLAELLEEYDKAKSIYATEFDSTPITKNGKKAPPLQVMEDLNRDIIQYFRELGLTASGLKKIGETNQPVQKSAFSEMMDKLNA